MKVAFQMVGGNEWYGGLSNIRALIYALKLTYKNDITCCLFASDKAEIPSDLLKQIDEVIVRPNHRKWMPLRLYSAIMQKKFCYDPFGENFFKKHKINIFFGLAIPYRYSSMHTFSWIPDFQHIHLPEMFNIRECLDQLCQRMEECTSCFVEENKLLTGQNR